VKDRWLVETFLYLVTPKTHPAGMEGGELFITRISAAWTAAEKPHEWAYGFPKNEQLTPLIGSWTLVVIRFFFYASFERDI